MTAKQAPLDSTPHDTARITWQVFISGRVQGVWFRAFTKERADELGVSGWVQNEADGSVTALIQHSDEAVLQRMTELVKHGPPHARVEKCDVEVIAAAPSYSRFEILR